MKTTTKNILGTCIALAIMGLINNASAQAPLWDWAQCSGIASNSCYGNTQGTGICTDAKGDLYVAGDLGSCLFSFGSDTVGNSENIFIAKYDSTGKVLWITTPSSLNNNDCDANSISADANGNVYVTGVFYGTLIFGSDTLNAGNSQSIYIVKYDSSGNLRWATNPGGNFSNALSYGISADVNGNVYVTGGFADTTIIFGSDTLTCVNNNYTVFLAKYNSSGKVLWATSAGGSDGYDVGYGVSTDAKGNIYVTGDFKSSQITFGTDTLLNDNPLAHNDNVFTAKYDSSGKALWAKGTGNHGDAGYTGSGNSVSTDVNGNAYVTGYVGGALSPIIFGNVTLPTSGSGTNIFVVKYDPSGNVLWATSSNGQGGSDIPSSISADVNGSVFVTGSFAGSDIIFGNDTLLSNYVYGDIFIVQYDSSGHLLWATNPVAKGSYSQGNSIITDAKGNAYFTGYFASDTITFGSLSLINNPYQPEDFFLSKLIVSGGVITAVKKMKDSDLGITIYPNPTQGIFNVQCSMFNVSVLEIYNVLGERVYQTQNFKSGTLNVDISTIPTGMYFVRLTTNEGNVAFFRVERID